MEPLLESILVVGMDANFCYLMQRYIRMSNRNSQIAYRYEDALAHAYQSKPVVIIVEIGLPDTLGWNILRVIKQDQTTSGIPIVACSWQDEELLCKKDGADVYLHMPILYEHFQNALNEVGVNA
jgi:CheY-like chemotaxis protein